MNRLLTMWTSRQENLNRQWVAAILAPLLLTFFRYYLALLIGIILVPRYPALRFLLSFSRFLYRWLYRRKFAVFPRRPWMARQKGLPGFWKPGRPVRPAQGNKQHAFIHQNKNRNGIPYPHQQPYQANRQVPAP